MFELVISSLDEERVVPLEVGRNYLLGRSAECEIVLDAVGVADIHARLDVTSSGCLMTDLNRRSRTRMNGQQLEPQQAIPFHTTNEVQIGLFTLHVRGEAETAEAETTAAEPDDTLKTIATETLRPHEKLYFQITVTTLESTYMEQFLLRTGATVVGRGDTADIQLASPRLRLAHARFEVSDEQCVLVNLHPRNRILVNNVAVEASNPLLLKVGDAIEMDWFTLTLGQVVVEEEEQSAASVATAETAAMPELDEGIISLHAGWTAQPTGRGSGEPPNADMPEFLRSAPPPPPDYSLIMPPGLGRYSVRYLDHLPSIYHTDFTSRFMAMFEAILMPISWNVENFDLYLNPNTAPPAFVDWLASWFGIVFDETWSLEKRRIVLTEIDKLLSRKGTKWALNRMLEIYLGQPAEIIEENQPPNTFTVRIPFRERDVKRPLIEQLIEAQKPAHTTYILEFATRVQVGAALSRLDF